MRKNRFRWWHGVVFYAGVQLAQLALRGMVRRWREDEERRTRDEDRRAYEAKRLPVFAPPGVAFPIAWGINSLCAIAGGLHVLNLAPERRGRSEFLRLQAAAWILYALFDTAYFGLRSPINAALVTFAYTGVTAASLDVALCRMREPKAALSLATTAAWLVLANPVAVTQAAWNRDPFWEAGPFCDPPAGWEKLRGSAEAMRLEAKTETAEGEDAGGGEEEMGEGFERH
ncbi:MAG: tryptophan-rich sensory protein [Acidobacteriaceae bacterium]